MYNDKIITLNNLKSFYEKLLNEHKLSEKADKTYVDNLIAELGEGEIEILNTLNELAEALNDNVDTVDILNQSISNKQDAITDLETIRQGAAKGATALQSSSLAAVATSGNYNDLTNKPTIPTAVTEGTVGGWGFTKNTGTYSKPSGGIPKTDLASAVQTSLGKADTALQSYTEQYKGTVTGVKVNGTTKNPSNGVVDLGTVITAHQTLKTINGESIIGSGDIVISGGGSSNANVQAVDTGDVLDDVTVNYATVAYVDSKVANIDLTNYATKAYVDGLIGDINSVLESIISGGIAYINISIYDSGTTDLSIEQIREIVQYCADIYDDEYVGPVTNFKYTFNNIKLNTINYQRMSDDEGEVYIIQAFTNNDEGELFIQYIDNSLGNEQVLSGYFMWN